MFVIVGTSNVSKQQVLVELTLYEFTTSGVYFGLFWPLCTTYARKNHALKRKKNSLEKRQKKIGP